MSVPRHFDRRIVRHRRNRAAAGFAAHDFLFRWALDSLAGRLEDVKRRFPLALRIGARGGPLKSRSIDRLVVMDPAEKFLPPGGVAADEEALPFAPASFDLVVSPLSLHTVNDLPGALIQIRRVLKPDGLLLAALPGGETLHELRAALMQAEINIRNGASPRVSPFAEKQQMAALMQRAGFALPVVDSDTVTATYDGALRLMNDLRGMGESNSVSGRSRGFTGRKIMAEAARLYGENFADGSGRIPATFEIVFLTGWAPHESQQKALRPGSAARRLAEALETKETGTGEIARP